MNHQRNKQPYDPERRAFLRRLTAVIGGLLFGTALIASQPADAYEGRYWPSRYWYYGRPRYRYYGRRRYGYYGYYGRRRYGYYGYYGRRRYRYYGPRW